MLKSRLILSIEGGRTMPLRNECSMEAADAEGGPVLVFMCWPCEDEESFGFFAEERRCEAAC